MTSASSLLPRPQIVHALVRRDYLVGRSYRLSLVLDPFFGVLNLLIYYFISQTFPQATTVDLGGAPSYFAFAAVGVALSLVVQEASFRIANRVREEQLTGTLEALVAQPITAFELSLGMAGFYLLFAMARAALYLTVAGVWLGVDFGEADWPGFAAMLVATAAAMLGIGVALAAIVLVVRRAELLAGIVTLLLALAGGAFFPVGVLPGWLQPLTAVVPSRFAFDGVRDALFSGEGWAGDAVSLMLFAVLALPLAVLAFKAALRHAKRRGTLAAY